MYRAIISSFLVTVACVGGYLVSGSLSADESGTVKEIVREGAAIPEATADHAKVVKPVVSEIKVENKVGDQVVKPTEMKQECKDVKAIAPSGGELKVEGAH